MAGLQPNGKICRRLFASTFLIRALRPIAARAHTGGKLSSVTRCRRGPLWVRTLSSRTAHRLYSTHANARGRRGPWVHLTRTEKNPHSASSSFELHSSLTRSTRATRLHAGYRAFSTFTCRQVLISCRRLVRWPVCRLRGNFDNVGWLRCFVLFFCFSFERKYHKTHRTHH